MATRFVTVAAGQTVSSLFVVNGGNLLTVWVPSLSPANVHLDFATTSAAPVFHSFVPVADLPAIVSSSCPTRPCVAVVPFAPSPWVRLRLSSAVSDTVSFMVLG
jgi:hypothetical protein